MIKFAKKLNLDDDNAVFQYLKEHSLYLLMNSWNRLRTFSNNIKIYNLDVDGDTEDKLFELLDIDSTDVKFAYEDGINDFEEEYTVVKTRKVLKFPSENSENEDE